MIKLNKELRKLLEGKEQVVIYEKKSCERVIRVGQAQHKHPKNKSGYFIERPLLFFAVCLNYCMASGQIVGEGIKSKSS